MTAPGLREQKKQATRALIADVATGLFAARGFDNVTVAEVAAAAGVSKMTVFNYFPRKEDLFLDRHEARVAGLRQAITARPDGESVVAAMRRHQHGLLAAEHPLSGAIDGVVPFWQVLQSSAALVSRTYEQAHEIREALAEVLSEQTGDPVTAALVAGLLTAAVTAVFDIALRRMLNGDAAEEVRRDQAAVIDQAFDLVEHGIGGLGGQPG